MVEHFKFLSSNSYKDRVKIQSLYDSPKIHFTKKCET